MAAETADRYIQAVLGHAQNTDSMKLRLLASLLLAATLAACDSAPSVAPDLLPSGTRSAGTMRALINGVPFEAPAEYYVDENVAQVHANIIGPPPNYYTISIGFSYWGEGPFVVGDDRPVFVPRVGEIAEGLRLHELFGDALVNSWEPVGGSSESLRIARSSSNARSLQGAFSATLVALRDDVGQYQQLSDTIRVTEGEFLITPVEGQ